MGSTRGRNAPFLRLSCINTGMARVRINVDQNTSTKDIGLSKIEQSRKWFFEKTQAIGRAGKKTSARLGQKEKLGNDKAVRPMPGMMYAFYYDPKHKETLPYYDTYPLVVIIELNSKGILGLNLHYLPMQIRQKFFYGALLNKRSNRGFFKDKELNEETFFEISYEYLKSTRAAKAFRPCIKQYLTPNIRGNIVHIPAPEWERAIHLPTASWEKEREAMIHRESLAMIGKF